MKDNYKIHLLEAKTGDSFIVECGNVAFIIDGGTRRVANIIKRHLENNTHCQLHAIFVTHVDRDHVGGIAKLFTHFRHVIPTSVPIYMNHPALVPVQNNNKGLVTFSDGDNLKSVLDQNGYSIKQGIANQVIELGDVNITILSPDDVLVSDLYQAWPKVIDEGLVSNDIIEIDCSKDPGEPKSTIHGDEVNASSMSFIVSYKNKNVLFLSDSLPITISNQLDRKIKFDAVKVSHHGSKYNTSKELLSKIDCNKFIISTNGPRNYGHPHAETIVRIINSCIDNKYDECTFYFNYRSVCRRVRLKNVPDNFKVNIEYSKSMSLL
ncbi:MBL fold metallo-hydrolase [Moritella marina ATCC 15381]|uniref:MBL fold metallo-hydrolase n=1 Tax=Moritella marina ATCC 15381 TaxID=1202962 RepID=A0A5J6WIH1_MORMI|nr:MBL fold metallo-hydrolase [Moritella marina]QFI37038.1 MBL fold metallo-hydrolase [Moritella marina ATCC 15381]